MAVVVEGIFDTNFVRMHGNNNVLMSEVDGGKWGFGCRGGSVLIATGVADSPIRRDPSLLATPLLRLLYMQQKIFLIGI